MDLDREQIKKAIKTNPEGHEKLTGRYYLTPQGIQFFNGDQPRPMGAVRIPSFADDHPFKSGKIDSEELAELLAQWFINRLQQREAWHLP